jgi:hypothetical protein
MRVIVAGTRDIEEDEYIDYSLVKEKLAEVSIELDGEITQIVSGGARGVDTLGEKWAYENGVPLRTFDVTDDMYEKYGKGAYKMRNRAMGEYGDVLVVFWDGISSGTQHMIEVADELDIDSYVFSKEPSLGDFV